MPKRVKELPHGDGITLNPAVYNGKEFSSAPPSIIYNVIGGALILLLICSCAFMVGTAIECSGGACRDLTPTATAIYNMFP